MPSFITYPNVAGTDTPELDDILIIFQNVTGRLDFTVASNEFLRHIQLGQRKLDRLLFEHTEFQSYLDASIAVDSCNFTDSNIRQGWLNVRKFMYQNTAGEFVELQYKDYNTLIQEYPKWKDTESGTPLYWTYEPISGTTFGAESYQEFCIMPPTDIELSTVRLSGARYQNQLLATGDKNWYTQMAPDMLAAAAIESYYMTIQNEEARREWERNLMNFVVQFDNVEVSQEMAIASEGVMAG